MGSAVLLALVWSLHTAAAEMSPIEQRIVAEVKTQSAEAVQLLYRLTR